MPTRLAERWRRCGRRSKRRARSRCRDGHVAGFLLGTRKDDANVGSERLGRGGRLRGGRARARPRSLRLRVKSGGSTKAARATTRWCRPRRPRRRLVSAELRRAAGARDQGGRRADVAARHTPRRARDIEALFELAPLISDHQALAPSSAASTGTRTRTSCARCSPPTLQTTSSASSSTNGTAGVVASFELAPVEKGSMHRGLHSPTAPRTLAGRRACRRSAARAPASR